MTIHPAIRLLIAEIEVFRGKTGMSSTAFGTLSLNDPKFVSDLHKGRTPSLSTMDKVRAFMQANDRAPSEHAGAA
ncbi:hypothetical protein LMTR13_11310 [Bradyrhizobium icense]|uniref:XRE family transcriptional regulator n=2 Tax=Bradyrhizobium icense TaxID=1274631 RepID=A0A1B1UD30_9BRAD|nr:hypothetical protein LMTR13_11310 [Bradyrhizobium icense]